MAVAVEMVARMFPWVEPTGETEGVEVEVRGEKNW